MIKVFCDGLCEPRNPGGTACFGWVAYSSSSEKLGENCGVICRGPQATNNVAEYTAIIEALKWLLKNKFADQKIKIHSDSQLCIKQLNNQYAVRSEKIRPLYRRAKKEAKKFKDLHFCWVPREQNKEADALSRKAYQDSIESSRLKKAYSLIGKIKQLDRSTYLVPSQKTEEEYIVDLYEGFCTCADHSLRGVKCKHILAAEIFAGIRQVPAEMQDLT